MFRIDRTAYGLKLTFGERIDAKEMEQWVKESVQHLQSQSGHFGVFVDMRTLKPLPRDARTLMEEGRKLYLSSGMRRSAVIIDNPAVAMHLKRLAQESGMYQWERYIDASKISNWEELGEAWIMLGDDPELQN